MQYRNIKQFLTILLLILANFSFASYRPAGDFTGDCIVDIADLEVLSQQWLTEEQIEEAGLEGYWSFEEISGNLTPDSSNNAYHGTIHGNPQIVAGKHKNCLNFGGIDDYVEIEGYHGIGGANPRTITAFIKANEDLSNTDKTYHAIISFGEATPNSGKKIVLMLDSNTGQIATAFYGAKIIGGQDLEDNLWHHIALVIPQGIDNIKKAKIYIDGNEIQTNASELNLTINTSLTENILIGASDTDAQAGIQSPGLYFKGYLDQVKIYNKELSNSEIYSIYQYGIPDSSKINRDSNPQIDNNEFAQIASSWNENISPIVINEFLADNESSIPPNTNNGEILDGLGEASDWLELYNRSNQIINLTNWSLTDNESKKDKWTFPNNTTISPGEYMLIFASKKEKKDNPNNYPYVDTLGFLHTNFSLSKDGEYLGLSNSTGKTVYEYKLAYNEDQELGYPKQEKNISFGLLYDNLNYFPTPTPANENKYGYFSELPKPKFSHKRGFYDTDVELEISSEIKDALIRYTLDGSAPSTFYGYIYTQPISISSNSPEGICVRAIASKAGYKDSPIVSHTYILNATSYMKGLPAISLSGESGQVFYNPNGVMAIEGGSWSSGVWQPINAGDYNNLLMRGKDYERPVSYEWIHNKYPEDFQEDCGLRIHGSAWMRPRYKKPSETGIWSGESKISQRLYFRNEYGKKNLDKQILEKFPEADKFDAMVIRAGHNDISNPFIRDEMLRRIHYYMGHISPRGTFANLFVNGIYKGYFNPCERINEDFCQEMFDSELPWDIVGWVQPDNVLEARDGDMIAFKKYIDFVSNNNLSNPTFYNTAIEQLDLVSFIDYLIVQSWSGNWDWPQNNWSAASERSSSPKWHFFIWDGEGGMDNSVSQNRLSELNSGGHDLAKLYRGLKNNPDFCQLFCDRLQKHFYTYNGLMKQENLKEIFQELASEVSGIIPNINTYIPNSFIPSRESIYLNQCISEGLFTTRSPVSFFNGYETTISQSANPMTFTLENPPGASGKIYYTTNGKDPRLSQSEQHISYTIVSEDAPKQVLIPTANIGNQWQGLPQYEPFDDSNWIDGLPIIPGKSGAVGYETDINSSSSNTPYISYNVLNKMRYNNTCAYIRIPFEISEQNISEWNFLTLNMRYDDGFAAYINGQKVAQAGFNGTPSWNSTASSHENNSLESFSISQHIDKLRYGTNILAIHGMNTSASSSDFVISVSLEGGFSTSSNISPSAIEYTSPILLDKSSHILSRTYNNGTWSALNEAKCLINNTGLNEGLRISEIMYSPNTDPNEEFIEFKNIGETVINLYNCKITDGITFDFPDISMIPGQYAIIVANNQVFSKKYGTELPVIGQYSGKLSNSGEKVIIKNVIDNEIQSINYDNRWYDISEKTNFSLTPSINITDPEILYNLHCYYPFNALQSNGIQDRSGHYTARLYGYTPKTRDSNGVSKNCLRLDGFNDHIVMPSGIMTPLDDFTFSCWIKLPLDYKSARILECYSDDEHCITITANLDGYYNITITSPTETSTLTSQAKTTIDQWTHFAITLSGSTCTMYEDGLIIGQNDSFALSPSDLSTLSYNWLGRSNDDSVANFDGWIDEVRFYNIALPPADIMTLSQKNIWNNKSSWRPSAIQGGTPGRAETDQEQVPALGSVVINEILAHSHASLPDWIELKNTTDHDIDISGWFISDSNDSETDRKKYQIPDNTILTPTQPYFVIDELSFNNNSNPQCRIPFALSEGGETLYLQSANGEELTGYYQSESFGASETNVSFGRHQKSSGSWNFVPMAIQTKGSENSYPKVGPVIITEIMYNPAGDNQDLEYIQITNISQSPVLTASYASTYIDSENTQSIEELIPWKFTEGIDFEFPNNLVLQPSQSIYLVKDKNTFESTYNLPQSTLIYEWNNGGLANEGEKIEISIPGDKEYDEDRYYIREDRVSYDDRLPWPFQADGTGKCLRHINPTVSGDNYTNDPANWEVSDPTPASN